MIACPHLYHH